MEPAVGPTDEVIRFRSGAVARWVGVGLGACALGLWSWTIVVSGEVEAIPVVVTLSVLIAAGLWVCADRVVVISADAIVMRSSGSTTTLPWGAVGALQRRGTAVWALTEDGWFVLPVPSTARPRDDRTGQTLGDEVWFTWLARRRHDWALTELRPWIPNRDLRGRVVLRPALRTRSWWLSLAGASLGRTLVPNGAEHAAPLLMQLGGSAVVLGVTATLVLAYHAWSRVTIDDDLVIVRSLSGGVRRIRRDQIVGVQEETDRFGFGTRLTRLALVARQPVSLEAHAAWRPLAVEHLVAPATGANWWENEPAYHRMWAWLHAELVATAGAVALDAEQARPTA